MVAIDKAHQDQDTMKAEKQEALEECPDDDLMVKLLQWTRVKAHKQANAAVDTFLGKICQALQKHVPIGAQGPLVANVFGTVM